MQRSGVMNTQYPLQRTTARQYCVCCGLLNLSCVRSCQFEISCVQGELTASAAGGSNQMRRDHRSRYAVCELTLKHGLVGVFDNSPCRQQLLHWSRTEVASDE